VKDSCLRLRGGSFVFGNFRPPRRIRYTVGNDEKKTILKKEISDNKPAARPICQSGRMVLAGSVVSTLCTTYNEQHTCSECACEFMHASYHFALDDRFLRRFVWSYATTIVGMAQTCIGLVPIELLPAMSRTTASEEAARVMFDAHVQRAARRIKPQLLATAPGT